MEFPHPLLSCIVGRHNNGNLKTKIFIKYVLAKPLSRAGNRF